MLPNATRTISVPRQFAIVTSLILLQAGVVVTQARIAAAAGLAPSDDKSQSAKDNDRLTTEIRARKEGRSANDMYEHLSKTFQMMNLPVKGRITNQETLLHATGAKVSEDIIVAKEIHINLPEGSNLRAKLSGKTIAIDPSGEDTMIQITNGELQVYGPDNKLRFETGKGNGETSIEIKIHEEVSISLKSKSGSEVTVFADLKSGIPENDDEPPHGAVRFAELTPDRENDPYRIKMQWIYDMDELKKEAIEENNEISEEISAYSKLFYGRR